MRAFALLLTAVVLGAGLYAGGFVQVWLSNVPILEDDMTVAVGTYVREPDGACLLMFSDRFWNDPPTGLRERPSEWMRAEYDLAKYGFEAHPDARYLAPGEWIKYDGIVLEVGADTFRRV